MRPLGHLRPPGHSEKCQSQHHQHFVNAPRRLHSQPLRGAATSKKTVESTTGEAISVPFMLVTGATLPKLRTDRFERRISSLADFSSGLLAMSQCKKYELPRIFFVRQGSTCVLKN